LESSRIITKRDSVKLNYFFNIKLILVKSSETSIMKELEKIKKLLVLQLSESDVPISYVAKAAEMSPNEIYKFIPKKRSKKTKKLK